ncbi:MAG: LysM peptidoglycan-binding domain-containing protein [Cyclobacteriaceae bacterium]|nr:LysM peptidoglycan-binding domain-containing protein [Cyclobacteriaceae bacterium]
MRIILIASCLLFVVGSFAQDTGKIRTISGKMYKIHLVQAGETLFALSRTYNVKVDELEKANPSAKQGLNIGQEILIPTDGVKILTGREKKHKVKAGETLFSISRQYEVTVDQIRNWNNLSDAALSVGQVLLIKKDSDKPQETATRVDTPIVKADPVAVSTNGDTHAVKAGETLFSISRQYQVSVPEIVEWNDLESTAINEGMQLVVKKPDPSNPTAATKETIKTDNTSITKDNEEGNNTQNRVVDKKDTPKETETVKDAANDNGSKPDKTSETVIDQTKIKPAGDTDDFVEVTESGVAELIPDTEGTRKYLALHRTVAPGTIIRVRNEINGREVWARVIGKLPDTGDNKNVLVKISKAAYDRLGALDKKFRVTITYIP